MIATKTWDLQSLIEQGKSSRNFYRPRFFRLSAEKERREFQNLIASQPGIMVHDELDGQLQELVKSLNPTIDFKADPTLLGNMAVAHPGSIPREEYGAWVYYPWSLRMVHILDETEFVA